MFTHIPGLKVAAPSNPYDVPDEPQPQLVEIHGRTISYLTLAPEEPSGAPVVLVHGFGGDKNSWLFVQQPLSEEHAVHALDLPGHGASGKDVGDGSLRAWPTSSSGSSTRSGSPACISWGTPWAARSSRPRRGRCRRRWRR